MLKIKSLKEIYKNYDTFILDQWGVMHDGNRGFLNAIKSIQELINKKKKLFIISNSSKRVKSTNDRLPKLGFNVNHFEGVMTSGEMIWQSLFNENYKQTKNLGKNCFHIYDKSKDVNNNYLSSLNKFDLVTDINKADFILGCTPLENKNVLDYYPDLEIALKKNLPFICANPDFDTVESKSQKLIFCIGTISEIYKNMGGRVFFLGKPSVDIYYEVTKRVNKLDKSKILAIGDSLHHDIKGAINFGVDSLLITSTGIHRNIFDKKTANAKDGINLMKDIGINPTFICQDLNF